MTDHTHKTLLPHLLAAWPGMGNVAVMAAGYLVRKLGMEPIGTISLENYFDVNHVGVQNGVVQRPRLPRGLLFKTPESHVGRPLLVFLSEAQPTRGGYAFVHELLDQLREHEVERVFTFASLASQVHPAENPKVTAAVTSRDLLLEIEALGFEPAADGKIGGLNGLLLGAAAEREMEGACLLAEIPAFAMRVPNPKAARAALSLFCELTDLDIDFEELNTYAESAERAMLRMLEQIQLASEGEEPEFDGEGFGSVTPDDRFDEPESGTMADTASDQPQTLDPEVEARIEQLFDDASHDRQAAAKLKAELDAQGVFGRYEDRFLDLFKRSG